MDRKVRAFYHDLIDLVNAHDLPWEVRRVVLENVLLMTEKKADEAIMNEDVEVDTIELGEEDKQCRNPIAE